MAGKDLNAILGPSGGSTFDLPAADSAFAGGGPPPAFAPPPPPSFSAPPPPRRRSRRRRCPASRRPRRPASPRRSRSAPRRSASGAAAAASQRCRQRRQRRLAAAGRDQAVGLGTSPPSVARPTTAAAPRRTADGDATRVVPYDADEEEEAHFRHIFDDFIAKKRDCGESTAGLTRDKFLQKLRDNKASLVAKHNCRTVRFSVYVKDGKAALKATPIRE